MERLSIDEAISNFKLFHKEDLEKLTYEEDFLKRFGYTKERLNTSAERNSQLVEWLEELKSYRDAEEQGLLLRLPCEYKTKVYVVPTNENGLKDIAEMLCLGYSIGEPQNNMNLFSTNRFNKDVPKMYQPSIDEFGKTVFLTKEEAEQKLAEMKGE